MEIMHPQSAYLSTFVLNPATQQAGNPSDGATGREFWLFGLAVYLLLVA